MSGVQVPGPDELPPGPLRTLTEALHELYRAAGEPGLRTIAHAVADDDRFRDSVSHQKVRELLHGIGSPRWSKLEPVVRVLAERSTPRRDPDEETKRFKHLWNSVASHDDDGEPPAAGGGIRIRSAFVLGGITGETSYPDFERTELEQFCQRLGVALAKAAVDLVICSPIPDSADFHALRGYVETGENGTVHMHRPHHPEVEQYYAQLHDVLGAAAVNRIKNWFYPGPATDDRDSVAQAWVLCQLMAMEQADVIIAVGGKPGKTASTILHLAEARQQPVVPFSFLGGAAAQAFQRRDWRTSYPWLDSSLLTDKHAVRDAVTIANQMVMAQVRGTGQPKGRPHSIFISRARPDRDYARALDHYLTANGLAVLFGERALPPDRTVEAAIEDAVRGADLFIVLWSRSYAASRYCYDEIDLALRQHRAGELQLLIINLDGSDIVPPGARGLASLQARTPEDVVAAVRDVLNR
ncbi:toll/interleukin-1 receptor domain-containing protein [Actinophytocola sp. NPDC049390]|uniref:toll/interleukin-1 receptor domain-containing protein n=1 Tax=Actinophytocola sp. NPDC049390 TaxID=3363894 RepID=UPI003799E2F6